MNPIFRKCISVLLALVMLAACALPAVAAAEPGENEPTIIIPGLFQSETHLYNDDGSLALDKNAVQRAYKGHMPLWSVFIPMRKRPFLYIIKQ